MDAELRAKWVRALRSGKFAQARYRLRAKSADGGYAYCCLGVLCKVANISIARDGSQCSGNRDYRPIRNLVGDGGAVNRLMNLNDEGAPFDRIADWVEQNIYAK